jgi:hypothetical protein
MSQCDHPQPPPTQQEIDGCPEVIVRRCPACGSELWWNIDRWKKL